jgi:hypothetical protein
MKPYWNFSNSRRTNLSLDEFLDGQDASKFFTGKEPWLDGLDKVTWKNFYRICTEEMDDLSQRAVKLVVEYCLEVLEEAEAKIQGKPTLARVEKALNLDYEELYENPAYQYHWAMHNPMVAEAVNRALKNRFPT